LSKSQRSLKTPINEKTSKKLLVSTIVRAKPLFSHLQAATLADPKLKDTATVNTVRRIIIDTSSAPESFRHPLSAFWTKFHCFHKLLIF
jgi:hypothetical protein